MIDSFLEEDDENEDDIDESKIYETGQIIRISVENFMCHRKFTMDFGRHLNYINGKNGSGKNYEVTVPFTIEYLFLCL